MKTKTMHDLSSNDYNNVQITSTEQKPNYLNKSILNEFAHLKIKSENGQHIQINHLLWISWSIFPKELLGDMFKECPEDMVISSDICIESLKIFGDFVMNGRLPFSAIDILEDNIPKEIYSMFLTFGIDIKFIVSNFHIKIEYKDDENILEESQNFIETKIEDESHHRDNNLEVSGQFVNIPPVSQTSLNIENSTSTTNSCCCKVKGEKLQNELKCDYCEQTFSWTCQMKAHRQKIHMGTRRSATLRNHKKFKKHNMVQCHLCCYATKRRRKNDHLNSHIKRHSSNKKIFGINKGHFCDKTVQIHKCDFCGDVSDVLYCNIGLESHTKHIHERSDNADGKFPCDICKNKTYDSLIGLGVHKNRIHNISADKPENKCDQCNKVFKSPYNLRMHMFNIHLKKKSEGKNKRERRILKSKVVCETCGKAYVDKTHLKEHIVRVHEVKNIKCDKCDAVLKNKYSLASHIKDVHKKVPCSFCGIMMSSNQVRNHVLSRHTENNLKPHQCELCGKGFGVPQNLKDHMNIHTGAKPYLCKHCGKSYSDQGNCRMHERTAHEGYKRVDKRKLRRKI